MGPFHSVVTVAPHEAIQVGELWSVELPVGKGVKANGNAVRAVRGIFGGKVRKGGGALVWIVRKERRSATNEAGVTTALKMMAKKRGMDFVAFDGEENDFESTLSVFGEAGIVVGVHGAGLANVVFCREDVKVVEIGMEEVSASDVAERD